MRRVILSFLIFLVVGTTVAGASTTWVLWGINKANLHSTDSGKDGVWAYVDAFDTRNDCNTRQDELARTHEDYQYACLPVEINPSKVPFY